MDRKAGEQKKLQPNLDRAEVQVGNCVEPAIHLSKGRTINESAFAVQN